MRATTVIFPAVLELIRDDDRARLERLRPDRIAREVRGGFVTTLPFFRAGAQSTWSWATAAFVLPNWSDSTRLTGFHGVPGSTR